MMQLPAGEAGVSASPPLRSITATHCYTPCVAPTCLPPSYPNPSTLLFGPGHESNDSITTAVPRLQPSAPERSTASGPQSLTLESRSTPQLPPHPPNVTPDPLPVRLRRRHRQGS